MDKNNEINVTFQKKPPFRISNLKLGDSFYRPSAKEQEGSLRGLLVLIKNHREKRFKEFIEMVRKA